MCNIKTATSMLTQKNSACKNINNNNNDDRLTAFDPGQPG